MSKKAQNWIEGPGSPADKAVKNLRKMRMEEVKTGSQRRRANMASQNDEVNARAQAAVRGYDFTTGKPLNPKKK